MRIRNQLLSIILALVTAVNAENAIGQSLNLSSGGSMKNENGSLSFSLGGVCYSSVMKNGIELEQGIQHAESDNENELNVEIHVFPNPTTDFLTIRSKDSNQPIDGDFSFHICELNGKVIQKGTSISFDRIDVRTLSSGVYLLTVSGNEGRVNSTQIIKQ